jgi:hypothetical protein
MQKEARRGKCRNYRRFAGHYLSGVYVHCSAIKVDNYNFFNHFYVRFYEVCTSHKGFRRSSTCFSQIASKDILGFLHNTVTLQAIHHGARSWITQKVECQV